MPEESEDAIDPAVVLGWATWMSKMWMRRKRIWAAATMTFAALAYFAGCATKARAIGLLDVRLTKVENATDSLRTDAKFQSLIVCLTVPSDAPEIARRLCASVIRRGIRP